MRPSCVRPGRSQCADRKRPSAFYQVKAEGVGFEPTVTLPPQWFSRTSVTHCPAALLPGLSVAVPGPALKIIPCISRAPFGALFAGWPPSICSVDQWSMSGQSVRKL
jgi:hypothetical protein